MDLPNENQLNDPAIRLSLQAAQRIDAVCLRFETAWRESRPVSERSAERPTIASVAQQRPQLQEYLNDVAEPERTSLLRELLLLELEYRTTLHQECPTEEDYYSEFPGHVELISNTFRQWKDCEETSLSDSNGQTTTSRGLSVAGYEIIGELGRGGMGVVYKARDLRLKRTVALKMILAGHHAGSDELGRFRMEAEAAARLQHPNIVQIFDIGEPDGKPYLTFELIEGVTLAEFTRREPQPPRLAAELVEALAHAIQYAHLSRNWTHYLGSAARRSCPLGEVQS
ncbi:MAG: hypothetical protein ACI9HK_006243 [Pirellulaceae bacterium]|jgi:hypothetical protein